MVLPEAKKTYVIAISKHPVLAFARKGNVYYITQRDEFVVKKVNQFGYYLYGYTSGEPRALKIEKFYVPYMSLRKLFYLQTRRK